MPNVQPIEKKPPLCLVHFGGRLAKLLFREPCVKGDTRIATPVFAFLIEEIGR